jgi:hypothetical protein
MLGAGSLGVPYVRDGPPVRQLGGPGGVGPIRFTRGSICELRIEMSVIYGKIKANLLSLKQNPWRTLTYFQSWTRGHGLFLENYIPPPRLPITSLRQFATHVGVRLVKCSTANEGRLLFGPSWIYYYYE